MEDDVRPKYPWQEETVQETSGPVPHRSENQKLQIPNQDFLVKTSNQIRKRMRNSNSRSQQKIHF